jgi:hypothetical protein
VSSRPELQPEGPACAGTNSCLVMLCAGQPRGWSAFPVFPWTRTGRQEAVTITDRVVCARTRGVGSQRYSLALGGHTQTSTGHRQLEGCRGWGGRQVGRWLVQEALLACELTLPGTPVTYRPKPAGSDQSPPSQFPGLGGGPTRPLGHAGQTMGL